jgi:zinc protease
MPPTAGRKDGSIRGRRQAEVQSMEEPMTYGSKALAFLSMLVFSAVLGTAGGQERAASNPLQTLALNQTLPVDAQITVGTLSNGLRYYIRANKMPENRAELRLVVNAGSVLEDNDQLGLAHFVEHMAFNGTKRFAKDEIVKFMESIGMRFGPSLNAFTGFDETVYMLQVPTDKPEVMQKAFMILEDWAHNLSFDPKEIDKERGVIVEEWRLGRGANARMQDQQFPVLLSGSRYAERLPIGKKEIIESFNYDALKRFYADWYRPDLMSVIAVGDFDKAAVEGLIKEHFASLPATVTPRLRPTYGVPDHPETLYAIATDKEATMTMVAVYNKLPLRDPTTVGAYRQEIVEQLYTGMLNRRYSELAQKPDPPFMGAGSGLGLFVRSKEAFTLSAMVKEGGIERGLDALFTEADRVSRFGFTPTELERQKRDVMRNYERLFAERDKRPSATLAAEYMRNFTQKEPIPGITLEFELCKRFLPEITLDEINKLGKEWTSERSRVVLASEPQKEGLAVPDGPKLAAVIKSAVGKEITPYVDTAGDQPLMEKLPESGKIIKATTKDAYGITEWELANGVKVVLKPTTNKQDEIVFRATSPGGTSLASDQDYVAASTAGQVIASGGLGKFNAIELRKVLSGKVASVRPVIGELEEGISGSASVKDLETMFQLIYLTFTQPRADPAIFGVLTAQMKSMLANQKASPDFAFNEALQMALTQNHLRARPMTPEMVDEMNLEKSFAFYKDRFADAGDFTFVFVGSFEPATMKPFVEQYLGALPSSHRDETWKNVGITSPKGVVQKTVKKGMEPQSQAAIVFTGPFKYTQEQRIAIRSLSLVLDTRLRETLREDLSGTYGVNAGYSYAKYPEEKYSFSISFGCNPERTEELIKAVFREIETLKANGPTEKQANDAREAQLRDLETNMKQNSYLLAQIYLKYQQNEDLKDFFGLPEFYKELSATMIHEAARGYLNTNNYVQVTLFPEKEKENRSLEELLSLLWPPAFSWQPTRQ